MGDEALCVACENADGESFRNPDGGGVIAELRTGLDGWKTETCMVGKSSAPLRGTGDLPSRCLSVSGF